MGIFTQLVEILSFGQVGVAAHTDLADLRFIAQQVNLVHDKQKLLPPLPDVLQKLHFTVSEGPERAAAVDLRSESLQASPP